MMRIMNFLRQRLAPEPLEVTIYLRPSGEFDARVQKVARDVAEKTLPADEGRD